MAASDGHRLGPLLAALILGGCAGRIDLAAVPALVDGDAAVAPSGCTAEARLRVGDTVVCAGGWLAARTTRALCSCEDYAGSAELNVGSFDGESGAYADAEPGGDVQIDGALNLGGDGRLRGALRVAGAAGLTLSGGHTLRVEGPLEVAGDLEASAAALELLGEAWVGGQLLAESLQVDGTLTMPDTARLQVSGTSNVSALSEGPVTLALGCTCDPFEAAPLEADTAEPSPAGPSPALDVCGSAGTGPLQSEGDVTIRGAGVLQIDGDVGVGGRLTFEVPDGGTLFVVVRGNLRADDGLVAAPADPRSRVHLLVGGSGTVQLGGETRLTGSLYAPSAELVASGPVQLHGALLVRRAAVSAPLELHFDRSLPAALEGACR